MQTKESRIFGLSIYIVFGCAGVASAQTGGGYDLTWSTIDSGGGTVSGGSYTLSGTVGQADAVQLTGGTYALDGGFWSGSESACTCQLFGDLVDVNSNPTPDCNIDVTDLLCVLDDFTDPEACLGNGDVITSGGGCASDGTIDVDDLLAVLDAFSGIFACPHPCAPS